MPKKKKTASKKQVDTLVHEEAKRPNIPTAEYESVMDPAQQEPSTLRYPRNSDLDPQLVWRGNLKNIYALFIDECLEQPERIKKLNRLAIEQMEILTSDRNLKRLEGRV